MKRLFLPFLLCIALLCARPASAVAAYVDGVYQPLSATGAFCIPGTVGLQTYASYLTDPAQPYPKTGDISYVRAVGVNVSGCMNDVVGFEFFLPDGASLAISANNPVFCYRGTLDGVSFENVLNTSNSSCSQTPSTGNNSGLFFSYSALPSGWYLDVRVPVVFNKKLLGLAGPTSHRLTIATSSVNGTAFPNLPLTVYYQAALQNLASSAVTSSSANLAFNLVSYFNSGLLYVDYGTTTALGLSLPSTSVPNTSLSFPITASLTGLNSSTTYYWRGRYVTSDGTFTSAPQSFTTGAGTTTQSLTVAKSGTGTVTSNTGGINCGATCSANFTSGTSVTLTANPGAGWIFSGWTAGPCTGSNPSCTVTMNSTQSVTALFARAIGSLSVTLGGLPSGAVVTLGISGPDGYSITQSVLSGTGFNLSDVPTGTYTVTAPTTSIGNTTYNAPIQSAPVNFGLTTTINVTYSSAALPSTAKNDFNGDGKSDLVWQLADGSTYIGLMNGTSFLSGGFQTGPGSTIKVVGVGDFNGDGKSDLVWQLADGSTYIGLMNGTSFLSGGFQTGPGSTIVVRP